MKWTVYFRNLAHVVKTKSKDESTQIGAVLVGRDNTVVSLGYNSFPRGIEDDHPERQERPEKYFWMEHAERNAIYNAARNGVSTLDTTMYSTGAFPCTGCARAIINAGVTTIYCEENSTEVKGSHWEEDAIRSMQMLREAKVHIVYYPPKPDYNNRPTFLNFKVLGMIPNE